MSDYAELCKNGNNYAELCLIVPICLELFRDIPIRGDRIRTGDHLPPQPCAQESASVLFQDE